MITAEDREVFAVITRIDEGVILRPRTNESFADFYFRITNRRRHA